MRPLHRVVHKALLHLEQDLDKSQPPRRLDGSDLAAYEAQYAQHEADQRTATAKFLLDYYLRVEAFRAENGLKTIEEYTKYE